MNIFEELEGIMAILEKDLRAYYFKPPNISWGILFPVVLALSFTLRNPEGLTDLAPGLIAMAALFGTTSMEAIVITFEKRVGALERLQLAPLNSASIIVGKLLGGTVFGLIISSVMTGITIVFLGAEISNSFLFIVVLLLTNLVHSSLGALVAVSVKEVFEAQTLSNYFRFPMIFLCGVFLPLDEMPFILGIIGRFLPLTYSVEGLRGLMLEKGIILLDVIILIGFSLILPYLSIIQFRRNQE
ncbi:ABC transporter permease [Candidatus Bathyarchaeota archaeon]|nr:ABC transporter permease [Candidatus Bathyarchaeota archaeon]